jgi:hypothetical protein
LVLDLFCRLPVSYPADHLDGIAIRAKQLVEIFFGNIKRGLGSARHDRSCRGACLF